MRRKQRKYKPIPIPKLNAKAIGHRLRALRVRRGWSQVTVSEKSGAYNSTISAIERGDRLPSRDVLLALATVFNVRIENILLGRGCKKSRSWSRDSGTGQVHNMPSLMPPATVRNSG